MPNWSEMQVQTNKVEAGKELTAQDNLDVKTIDNFLKTSKDDAKIRGILESAPANRNPADVAALWPNFPKVLAAYDNLKEHFQSKQVEIITLTPIDNILTSKQGNALKFKNLLNNDPTLQADVTKWPNDFKNDYMKVSDMNGVDKWRIQNFFKNYLGLSWKAGTDVEFDRNAIERMITTTKSVDGKSVPVPQNEKTITANIKNIDITKYTNDMPTLQQKIEAAYPWAVIDHVRPDEIQISYSLESIYDYAAKTLGDVRNAASWRNMEQTNQRASGNTPKYNDEALGNIKTITNLDAKQKLVKATSTIYKSAQHGAYEEINKLNVKAVNSALDWKTVKDISGATYSSKRSIDFTNPGELINVGNPPLVAPNGKKVVGKLEVIDGDIWMSEAKIGEIKWNIYEINNGKLNIYGLDENSYIDKLASQPTEMKNIESSLKWQLSAELVTFNSAADALAKKEIKTDKDKEDMEKDKRILEVQLNKINGIAGKIQDFLIPIDKPNDLAVFTKDKEVGKKSRKDAMTNYRNTVMVGLDKKLATLSDKIKQYDKDKYQGIVDKAYGDFLNWASLTKNKTLTDVAKTTEEKNKLADMIIAKLVKDTYGVDISEVEPWKRDIKQVVTENTKETTSYFTVSKDAQWRIKLDSRRNVKWGSGADNYFNSEGQFDKRWFTNHVTEVVNNVKTLTKDKRTPRGNVIGSKTSNE